MIAAYSFRTVQARLPKELALAGITAMAAANTFLAPYWLQVEATFAVLRGVRLQRSPRSISTQTFTYRNMMSTIMT